MYANNNIYVIMEFRSFSGFENFCYCIEGSYTGILSTYSCAFLIPHIL